MRKLFVTLSCLAVATVCGCSPESNFPTSSGSGFVRAINAIPTSPDIQFLIEESTIGAVAYTRITAENEFDNLSYAFNFAAPFSGEPTLRRIASVDLKVEDATEYIFLISGDIEAPDITLWESPVPDEENDTVFEVQIAHTAVSSGPVDVYFAAPGIAPAMGKAVATLSFKDILPATDYPPGDYVLTFTEAGQPGQIVYQSATISPSAQGELLIAVFDSTANDPGNSPVSVVLANPDGSNSKLPDAGTLSTVRFFHASQPTGATDIYTDEMLNNRILANHEFRDVSDDLDIVSGNYELSYTSAGNVGSILLERPASIFPGSINHFYFFTDETGALDTTQIVPDRRSVATGVKFQFTHTAANHPLVDLYIVEAGTDIANVTPRLFSLRPGDASNTIFIPEGDVELYLTPRAEKTAVAGPYAISTTAGDVLQFVAYDNVDPSIADIVPIPIP